MQVFEATNKAHFTCNVSIAAHQPAAEFFPLHVVQRKPGEMIFQHEQEHTSVS
jgi:hypothetical protein